MAREAWELAKAQHWVITRQQLLAIGYTARAIDVRIEDGRLHRTCAGIYAVGRPHLTREGAFIAAVLACGDAAALSHHSAAELWEIRPPTAGPIHVSVTGNHPRRPRIKAHRRVRMEITVHKGIPVTTPACTIVDVAPLLTDARLERCINEAANRNLIDPERLRVEVAAMPRRQGARKVLGLLNRDTYAVTESRLEQRLLKIVREAGLPKPHTQRRLGGGRVDFYWPDLGLIVEADSLRYHRTPSQQRADRIRDQKHAAAGITTLRFTHWQIMFDPDYVRGILTDVAGRLAGERVVPVGDAA
jgi:very-short-patch-repair endonuclease